MDKHTDKVEALRARWFHEGVRTDLRHEAITVIRAIQLGEKDWESYLRELPFVEEVEGGRDLRGLDISAMKGIPGLRYARDGFLDLRGADLHKADLSYANLYRVHLENANLYNTNLSYADMTNTHLAGAIFEYVKLDGAKLARIDLRGFNLTTEADLNTAYFSDVRLGDTLVRIEQFRQEDGRLMIRNELNAYEFMAQSNKDRAMATEALINFQTAREVYLALKNNFASIGEHRSASWAAYKEKEMEKQILKMKLKLGEFRGVKKIQKILELLGYRFFDKLFMYGENPWRLVWWAIAVIAGSAVLHPFSGIMRADGREIISYYHAGNLGAFIQVLLKSLYFSAVSFTTLGFGDYVPVGAFSHFLSVSEALLGLLFLGFFVWTLGRSVSAR